VATNPLSPQSGLSMAPHGRDTHILPATAFDPTPRGS
jgi:hypothetical protein